jgi:endonuclease YncB( thermonuclease family)
MRKATVLLVALVLVAAVVAAVVRSVADEPADDESPGFVDRDCADFATQARAQRFFERQGGPGSDPHLLDPDRDGIACETRPCPCLRPGEGAPEAGESREAEVVYVVDGDTIGVRRGGGATYPVRVLGIDAPETRRPRECGGKASEAHLVALLPRGARVTLTTDPTQDETDRFDREVRDGYAAAYAFARPPFGRVEPYLRAERKAREANRGNWSRCGSADG